MNHRNVIIWAAVFTAGLTGQGCRKEPVVSVSPATECAPLPDAPWTGWTYQYADHWIKDARFNPTNPDEILFTHAPYGNPDREVYVFRLSTGERTKIHEGAVISPAEWLDGERILLNSNGARLLVVDRSGESVTELTGPIKNAPFVDRVYNRIGCTTPPSSGLILDFHGAVIDSFGFGCSYRYGKWMDDGRIAELYCTGLEIVDPWSCTRTMLAAMPSNDSGCGAGLVQGQGTTVLWSVKTGLYRTNVQTGATTLLRNSCDSEFLLGLSYDPVNRRILSTRQRYVPDGVNLQISSTLVVLDENGRLVREIDVSW